jgi:hypothetical protein
MEGQLIFIGNVVSKKQVQPNPCGSIREMNMINKKGYRINRHIPFSLIREVFP